MNLTDSLKQLFMDTAAELTGAARRLFMAKVVKQLGSGGQSQAAPELGWNRGTIRKGLHELESGITGIDNYTGRGRQPCETHLPERLADLKTIVDSQSQTDPKFKSTRLYVRLSVREIRPQLVEQMGYLDHELPSNDTRRQKLNQSGYHQRRVLKTKPQKKIPETDAIFSQLLTNNQEAKDNPTTLRISVDAKATVKLGAFDRGGQTRVCTTACDHEFATETVTPYGILLPHSDELFIYLVSSKLTSDCLVDILPDWWQTCRLKMPQIRTLVINQDHGPENNSSRTQFMKRLVEFAQTNQLEVQLAYYPPYHSKYNPIERVWACLEPHWNGSLLDEVDTAVQFAKTMTWKGKPPVVKVVTKTSQTGVKLTKIAMAVVESQLERLAGLGKWFIKMAGPTDS
jgi:hypothetical protein